MVTPAGFLDRFPEFAGVADGQIEMVLADAALEFSEVDSFPTPLHYDRAHMLYAAHRLVLRGYGETEESRLRAQGAGMISSVSDSGVTISFNKSTEAFGWGSTSYGRELADFLERHLIRGLRPIIIGTVGGDRDISSPRYPFPVLRRE